MKKLLSIILASITFFTSFTASFAYEEYIGDMYSTSTTAVIDCHQIPVYVFNNYPYIVAEDLNGYGFDIKWVQSEQTLYLNYNPNKGYFPYENLGFDITPSYAGPVYSSDIKVLLNNTPIPSYSLNGQMLISLDELWRFGKVNWYDESLTIAVTTNKFIRENPEWETLMPPLYLADKVSKTFALTCYIYLDMIETMSDAEDQYNSSYIFNDHNCYVQLQACKNYLNSAMSYIEKDQYMYERGNLYHLIYNTISIVDNVEELYQLISTHNLSWTLNNFHYIENIDNSMEVICEDISTYSDNIIENIVRYITLI